MEGQLISHFRVLAKLGQGGMGVVYKAHDETLLRLVALKVLPPELVADPERRERLLREARAAAAVSHPAVATILEVGQHGDVFFVALELVEGRTLREMIAAAPLPPADAVRIAMEVAEALESAHRIGIVHRDLKPDNVMVRADGRIKVLDFGLAKLVAPAGGHADDEATRTELTQAGFIVGTAPYMSPEQARGEPVDARTDLFALGVVLYETLAGRNPFRGPTVADTLSAILTLDPPPLATVRIDVPARLSGTVERLLAKGRDERPASAAEVRAELALWNEDAPAAKGRPGPSIAVLPFVNMSADPEQEYFGEGIAEELIHALSQCEGLRVAARMSAFQFRGKAENLKRIGAELRVENVLEGSVRKAGGQLRVTAQLVSVADGYQIWSARYDRKAEDVFAIQDEITAAIVEALKVELGVGGVSSRATRQSPGVEAYELYLKGRYHWYSRDARGLQKALSFFQQAIEREPRFALAHAEVAACHTVLGSSELVPPAIALGRAMEAAERALAIEPDLPEGHAAIGFIHWCRWEWAAAEQSFRRALSLDPFYIQGRCWYAYFLAAMGRHDEARTEIQRVLDLDPLSHYVHMIAGEVFRFARRYDEAIAAHRRALSIHPDAAFPKLFLGVSLTGAGRYDEAEAELEASLTASGRSPLFVACVAAARALAGRRETARAMLEELHAREQSECVMPALFALIHAGLGEADQTFEWAERAFAARDPLLKSLQAEFVLDPLRGDPRMADLVRRLGLA